MGSMITRAKRIRIGRFSTQLATLAFLNMPLFGLRGLCAPVFYCHSCPIASMACPLGVLVNFSTLKLWPFITLGILGLVGTLGGRFVCGWLCPFGFIQDMLHKLGTRKLSMPPALRYVKYVMLIGFIFAVPYFWPGKPYTFCDGCPSGTLESMIPWAFVGHWDVNSGLFGGFTARFFTRISILVGVLLFTVFVSRGFCRMLCPLGAIFGLFNRFSLFRYNLAHKKCNSCGVCAKVCPVDIDPVAEMNTAECIRCYECTTTKHIAMGAK